MKAGSDIARRVEEVFSTIWETRMRAIPILNSALRVEAVGPLPWRGWWVLVLVTPWFMNLMMIGRGNSAGELVELKPGDTCSKALPGGDFAFLVGEEDGLGPYLSCSLFSPMQGFRTHEHAMEVGSAALKVVMTGDPEQMEYDESAMASEKPANPARRKFFAKARNLAAEIES